MTNRLYFSDAYQLQFQARLVEIYTLDNGRTAVVLDQSAFYPESGGQPADHGRIESHSVIDIQVREKDQALVHILAEPLEKSVGDWISAEIDQARRFNHMQQHTGQHILSRAFVDCFEADTVGFHLSADYCTIDLNHGSLSQSDLLQAEQLANQIVWENRPIYTRLVSHKHADTLPLRKRPPVQSNQLRLIEIEGFDLNACGGTHVAHTGEVGQIKITKVEKRKKKLRVTFLCGSRAWHDYDTKNKILQSITSELTTSQESILDSIQKMRGEIKQLNKTIKSQRQALMQVEISRLRENAYEEAGLIWFVQTYDSNDLRAEDLRPLVSTLTRKAKKTIVLLGLAGEKAQIVLQHSGDVTAHMGELLQSVLPLISGKGGGGRPESAQGGHVPATAEQITQALSNAKAKILDTVN